MKSIVIANKTLLFDKDFVDMYEETTCSILEEMAPIYLCAETKTQSVEEAIEGKTDEEISQIIINWARFDLEGMGISYGKI